MSMTAIPARRGVPRTKITGHAAWRRFGRLTALTVTYALVLTLLHTAIPTFSDWWIAHNLFALCYPYLLLAAWLGDVWEALSAVIVSAAVTAWMILLVLRPMPYVPFWVRVPVDGGSWVLYVASAIAIVGLLHRCRGVVVVPTMEAAAPVVAADMDSPVLVINGQVQVLQGGGVVFDSGTQHDATEQLHPAHIKHD